MVCPLTRSLGGGIAQHSVPKATILIFSDLGTLFERRLDIKRGVVLVYQSCEIAMASQTLDLLALLTLLTIVGFGLKRVFKRTSKLPLPPGPKPLPIIGNLFDVPKVPQWIGYHNLSKKYGAWLRLLSSCCLSTPLCHSFRDSHR